MNMAEGLDTGDMLFKSETQIGENETASELHDRLSVMGAELIVKTLTAVENNTLVPQKQNDEESSYAPMLTKELCNIDWSKSAQEVHNKVRGLNSWPVAVTFANGKRLKVFSTRIVEAKGEAGTVIKEKPLTVACGDKSVEILEVQPEGKKRMSADDYVRGYRIAKGTVFG